LKPITKEQPMKENGILNNLNYRIIMHKEHSLPFREQIFLIIGMVISIGLQSKILPIKEMSLLLTLKRRFQKLA